MATGRMLRKQISLSEQVNDLSLKAALLYTWMLAHADDYGRMHGSPRRVKAEVVPMRGDIADFDVLGCLQEMRDAGLITCYEVEDEPYLQFPSWERHQAGLHKRTESKFPPPPEFPGTSRNLPPNRTEQNRTEQEPNSRELYSPEFEAFWEHYPRKIAKKTAWNKWKTALKSETAENLAMCAHYYARACEGKDMQYIMHPATFLGPGERWNDYRTVTAAPQRTSRAAAGLQQWMEGEG